MTEKEKIIASAYTGYMFVSDFALVHKYIEEKLGRSIHTHKMADRDIQAEIHEKVKPDFISMIRGELDGNEKEPGGAGERTTATRKRNSKTKELS